MRRWLCRITSYNVCYTKLLRILRVVPLQLRLHRRVEISPMAKHADRSGGNGLHITIDPAACHLHHLGVLEGRGILPCAAPRFKAFQDLPFPSVRFVSWIADFQAGAGNPPSGFRITSYNVCYTKLLRFVSLANQLPGFRHQGIGQFA